MGGGFKDRCHSTHFTVGTFQEITVHYGVDSMVKMAE